LHLIHVRHCMGASVLALSPVFMWQPVLGDADMRGNQGVGNYEIGAFRRCHPTSRSLEGAIYL